MTGHCAKSQFDTRPLRPSRRYTRCTAGSAARPNRSHANEPPPRATTAPSSSSSSSSTPRPAGPEIARAASRAEGPRGGCYQSAPHGRSHCHLVTGAVVGDLDYRQRRRTVATRRPDSSHRRQRWPDLTRPVRVAMPVAGGHITPTCPSSNPSRPVAGAVASRPAMTAPSPGLAHRHFTWS